MQLGAVAAPHAVSQLALINKNLSISGSVSGGLPETQAKQIVFKTEFRFWNSSFINEFSAQIFDTKLLILLGARTVLTSVTGTTSDPGSGWSPVAWSELDQVYEELTRKLTLSSGF